MSKFFKINILFYVILAGILFVSCSDSDNDNNSQVTVDKNGNYYVLLTGQISDGQGFATAYGEMPSGDIKNVREGSLSCNANGISQFGKWVFKRASLNPNRAATLIRYKIDDKGNIVEDAELSGKSATSRFIYNDTLGFFTSTDMDMLKVYKFNPTTMQRTGEIDLSKLKSAEYGYQAVGTSFMVAKEGKLYVNYYTNVENEEENFRKNKPQGNVKLVVIDIATGKYEKTIRRDGINFIGYPGNENQMWCMGDDGALYMCSYGFGATGVTNKSAIVRIKKGETDFDQNWIIKADDFTQGTTFGAVCVKNNKLYTLMSSYPMDFKTILTDDSYAYYAFDKEDLSKAPTKILDVPTTTYPFVCGQDITVIDNKIYFRVVNNDKKYNGYYVQNSDGTYKPAFNVTSGGTVWGLCKVIQKAK